MYLACNPYKNLNTIERNLGHFFGNNPYLSGNFVYNTETLPDINVYENDDEVLVSVLLPGVNKENISISFTNNLLLISGNRKIDTDDTYRLLRGERTHKEFKQKIKINTVVNSESINAKFADGILKITLTKAEEAKPKSININ